jgi:diguanylate cyclase (GGDEF)-like protein
LQIDGHLAAKALRIGGYGDGIPNDGGVVNHNRRHLRLERGSDEPGSRRRLRHGKRRALAASGLSFMVRWAFAVSAAMVVAGLMEYGFARQQIVDRAMEDSRRNYEVLAEGLEEALAAAGTDAERREHAIEDEIHHLQHSPGTVRVGLFDAAGRLVTGGEEQTVAGELEGADPTRFAEVLATGQTAVKTESSHVDTGERGYQFLVPLTAPEGTLVLEIDQHPGIINELIQGMGQNKLLGLLTAIAVAIPLSYLFGGRSLQRRHLRAQRQADADPLTGLSGRRPFNPSLEAVLADRRYGVVSLALLDVDGFKQLNDRLGHSHGDRVLQALADSFEELAAADTPFRLGGDEFAVILPGSDEDQAAEALTRVRVAFAARFPGVTFSVGIAASGTHKPLALTELWERSDAALYEAKRLGRHRSVSFKSMAEGHTVSAEKTDELTALVSGTVPLNVAFQPIWDLRRGVVLAHEALLRLPHSSRISGPQEAFELAERLGIAADLDSRARSAVLAEVCSQGWEGLLFLNLHPDALPGFDLDNLVAELAVAGLEPEDVVLEITEQAGLNHPDPIRTLRLAQDRGFRLALDDMGRSNAGLHALRLVRFDIVKIDGEVIANLEKDPSSAATVSAAISFVQQAGGWIVAEGIEEPPMLDKLLQHGLAPARQQPVIAGQGYLLGRPKERPLGINTHLAIFEQQITGPAPPDADLDDLYGNTQDQM